MTSLNGMAVLVPWAASGLASRTAAKPFQSLYEPLVRRAHATASVATTACTMYRRAARTASQPGSERHRRAVHVSMPADAPDQQLVEGAQMQGVDYLLIRPDGVAVIDARETIRSTHGAGATHARAMGYIGPPFDMPPLEALLDPQFEWPDVDLPMHGAVTLESGQKGSPMNSTVYAFIGQVNLAKGQLGIAARAIG